MVTAVTGPGTAALPEGDRIDFAELRRSRRARLVSAMVSGGLDVLLLGRAANIQFATGARQLWTSGARPFGPGGVVVRQTGRIHLLSTWDEGVPAEIGTEELFGMTWNGANLMARLAAIPGLREARRVGTDGVGPATEQLLAALAPAAELVDATPVLRAARSRKSPEEVACIATAAALAEGALVALSDGVGPGVTERQLAGIHSARLAELGAPTPGWEAAACATAGPGPVHLRRVPTDRTLAAGELVALTASAMYAGYEADVARTVVCPERAERGSGGPSRRAGHPRPVGELLDRGRAAQAALIRACRPGATGADIQRAWAATGEALPPEPLVFGIGLGLEAPVIGPGLGSHEELEEGMTLRVQAWVDEEGLGGVLRADVVLVTADGAEVLTRA